MYGTVLKRAFDFVAAAAGLILLAPLGILVAIAVAVTSRGPVLYWSRRVGKGNALFAMPKFRTMKTGTPAVATHLLDDAQSRLTPIGGFLRRSSLDEIPQLWCVIRGQMSLVGPRPALYSQDDLIEARTHLGVHALRPGITGWAQVNGRDELSIPEKVQFDRQYLKQASMTMDFRILLKTVGKLKGDKTVAH